MGKIDKVLSKIRMLNLNSDELKAIIAGTKKILGNKQPYRIKPVVKRCGNDCCSCKHGSPHGPYLYVSYRENGVAKQKSLGLQLVAEETDYYLAEVRPDWKDETYRLPPSRYEKMDEYERHNKGLFSRSLSDEDFYELYGTLPSDDTLNRPTEIWVAYSRYERDLQTWLDKQNALSSKWGVALGLGTTKGHQILLGLEERGYYWDWGRE